MKITCPHVRAEVESSNGYGMVDVRPMDKMYGYAIQIEMMPEHLGHYLLIRPRNQANNKTVSIIVLPHADFINDFRDSYPDYEIIGRIKLSGFEPFITRNNL